MRLRWKKCFELSSNVINSLDRLLIFFGRFLHGVVGFTSMQCIRLRNIPLTADERALHITANVILLGSENVLKLQVSGIDIPIMQALDELPIMINE